MFFKLPDFTIENSLSLMLFYDLSATTTHQQIILMFLIRTSLVEKYVKGSYFPFNVHLEIRKTRLSEVYGIQKETSSKT